MFLLVFPLSDEFSFQIALVTIRWIDLLDDDEVINKRLHFLKDRHWLDKQTKKVTFELLVLNGQHDPLICEIKLNCLFTRGLST